MGVLAANNKQQAITDTKLDELTRGNRHSSWIYRLLIGIDVVAGCSLHPAIECIGNAAGGKRRGVRNHFRTLTSENCLIRNHRASAGRRAGRHAGQRPVHGWIRHLEGILCQ